MTRMTRRVNFTERTKIPRSRVRIRIVEEGARRKFDAEFHLDGLRLPEQALLFVEAYYRAAYQRFDFGTVGNPHSPSNRYLDQIPKRKPLFRVKAVLREDGIARIVGAADKVVPEDSDSDEDARRSLLPVDYVDLGDQIWRLEFDEDWPRLLLNERFEGIREAARSGPEFVTLVYPEVFRAILKRICEEDRFDPDSNDDDWGTVWLRFACRELHRPHPPDPSDGSADEWINEAVNAFCVRMQTVSRFEQMLADQSD